MRLRLTLKSQDLQKIRHRLDIKEAPVSRRANVPNCLHLECRSSQITRILSANRKDATNVGNAHEKRGLEDALLTRREPPVRLTLAIERSWIIAMVSAKLPQGLYRRTLDLIVAEGLEAQTG